MMRDHLRRSDDEDEAARLARAADPAWQAEQQAKQEAYVRSRYACAEAIGNPIRTTGRGYD